ncbi:MAG TPA: hypothetical protein VE623_14735 [Acidimicrobiales bacterium]|nr:hypothetical protein [Acidimicrobiales bacterium]
MGVRIDQEEQPRTAGLLLLDAGAVDVFRLEAAMPDVSGPLEAVPFDTRMTGRDLRIVDAAYDPDADRVGPRRSTRGSDFAMPPTNPACTPR